MSIEKLKAAFDAATPRDWEFLPTCGQPHVACLTESGIDVQTIAACGTNADAEFIALAHNLMPQLLKALELVEVISRMETGGENQELAGDNYINHEDASETLTNLIESSRGIVAAVLFL